MIRQVDEREHVRVIAERKAVKDPAFDKPGGIGEVERWMAPDGKACAWLIVRCRRGENEHDCYVNDRGRSARPAVPAPAGGRRRGGRCGRPAGASQRRTATDSTPSGTGA